MCLKIISIGTKRRGVVQRGDDEDESRRGGHDKNDDVSSRGAATTRRDAQPNPLDRARAAQERARVLARRLDSAVPVARRHQERGVSALLSRRPHRLVRARHDRRRRQHVEIRHLCKEATHHYFTTLNNNTSYSFCHVI